MKEKSATHNPGVAQSPKMQVAEGEIVERRKKPARSPFAFYARSAKRPPEQPCFAEVAPQNEKGRSEKKWLVTIYTVQGGVSKKMVGVGDSIIIYLSTPFPKGDSKVEVTGNAKVTEGRSRRLVNGKNVLTGTNDKIYIVRAEKKGMVTVTITSSDSEGKSKKEEQKFEIVE